MKEIFKYQKERNIVTAENFNLGPHRNYSGELSAFKLNQAWRLVRDGIPYEILWTFKALAEIEIDQISFDSQGRSKILDDLFTTYRNADAIVCAPDHVVELTMRVRKAIRYELVRHADGGSVLSEYRVNYELGGRIISLPFLIAPLNQRPRTPTLILWDYTTS